MWKDWKPGFIYQNNQHFGNFCLQALTVFICNLKKLCWSFALQKNALWTLYKCFQILLRLGKYIKNGNKSFSNPFSDQNINAHYMDSCGFFSGTPYRRLLGTLWKRLPCLSHVSVSPHARNAVHGFNKHLYCPRCENALIRAEARQFCSRKPT